MHSSLALRAGPTALEIIRERGLRFEDVDVVPAASGGPKWLSLAGLDRYLFGEFLTGERNRPLHCIGSSIGSWRMSCLARHEPLAALERGHDAYIREQRYPPKPTPREVSAVLGNVLDLLLGADAEQEILTHPWVRLHVITNQARGWAASDRRLLLALSLGVAAVGNVVSRRTLGLQMRRCIFHTAGDTTPFAHLRDLPTTHLPLTRTNLRPALLASGAIPLLLEGVRIDDAPEGVHWDGGLTDYHLDLDFGAGEGLILYPHFYPHVIPGWFDRSLRWRRGRDSNFRRALVIAPSAEFVSRLPGAKIPDRKDFYGMTDAERMRRWRQVLSESQRLGDELQELVTTGRLAERVQPW